MNQIKLVVSDLDGTLLNDNKEIDSKILDVIKSLYEKGILFTIATGRNYSLSKKIINVLGINIPYVCDNGGSIYQNNNCIKANKLTFNDVINISFILDKYKVPYVVYGFNYLYSPKTSKKLRMFLDNIGDIKRVTLIDELCNETIVKITLDTESVDNVLEIKKEVEENFKSINFNKSEDALYTITDINSTKGNGLEFVVNELGITLNNVLAIGDNFNDYYMFEKAGIRVSIKNSKKELLAISDYVAGSNNNDGVSEFLIEYFNLKL